jgi:ABC-type uncharacterized transport system ATPase subunit
VLLRVDKAPAKPRRCGAEVEDLRVSTMRGGAAQGRVLEMRAGEILGIAGVAGNGQSELLEVLGGMIPATGTVTLNGQEIDLTGKHPATGSRGARAASPMCPRTASARA